MPPGCDALALLQQRRDGVLGTPVERERMRALEHSVYRPGASGEAEAELSALQQRLHSQQDALDTGVRASGMLDTEIRESRAASAEAPDMAAPTPPAPRSPSSRRSRWTRSRILPAALGAVALAAVLVVVVQASAPRSSLEVFARAADPIDEGRTDFVTQVLQQGVMGSGPVRYLGEEHGVRVFAALVGDTFHNPIDPQEGVCLTGFLGGERLDTSTTNCALRGDFDRSGVAVFFSESATGDLEASAVGDATRALVWGPTGSLREVSGGELAALVAAGCSEDTLSFRARENCAR